MAEFLYLHFTASWGLYKYAGKEYQKEETFQERAGSYEEAYMYGKASSLSGSG